MRKVPVIYVGDVFTTNKCGDCKVIRVITPKSIKVKFLNTGFVTVTSGYNLRRGCLKDPYCRNIYNVGYIGRGAFSTADTKLYFTWVKILERCYSKKFHVEQPTYKDCTISDRWANFQNFCHDVVRMKNYDTPGFEIDKDLRVPGNKVYGKEFCSFIPAEVNTFYRPRKPRKSGLPQGVARCAGGFYAKAQFAGKKLKSKLFATAREAAKAYKVLKIRFSKYIVKKYGKVLHNDVKQTLLKAL